MEGKARGEKRIGKAVEKWKAGEENQVSGNYAPLIWRSDVN